MLGFVSLGIPGTNHKGTGADHASSFVVCVPESVLRTYRRLWFPPLDGRRVMMVIDGLCIHCH